MEQSCKCRCLLCSSLLAQVLLDFPVSSTGKMSNESFPGLLNARLQPSRRGKDMFGKGQKREAAKGAGSLSSFKENPNIKLPVQPE